MIMKTKPSVLLWAAGVDILCALWASANVNVNPTTEHWQLSAGPEIQSSVLSESQSSLVENTRALQFGLLNQVKHSNIKKYETTDKIDFLFIFYFIWLAYDIIDYLSIPREYILGYVHLTYKRIGPWCWFNSYLRNITYGKLSFYERFKLEHSFTDEDPSENDGPEGDDELENVVKISLIG